MMRACASRSAGSSPPPRSPASPRSPPRPSPPRHRRPRPPTCSAASSGSSPPPADRPGRSSRSTATGDSPSCAPVAPTSSGRARRAPRDHMRIASVAKAFSGAVALHLVQEGRLGLDDTIGQRRPDLPRAWAAVTVRQLLNHTSGVPDYTRSAGFARQFEDRSARLRLAAEDHRLGPQRPAGVHDRLALRVLEHRQHRRRADRRGA